MPSSPLSYEVFLPQIVVATRRDKLTCIFHPNDSIDHNLAHIITLKSTSYESDPYVFHILPDLFFLHHVLHLCDSIPD